MRSLLLFVSVVVFADTAFYSAITPILPDLADEFGLSKGAAGALSAAYPAGTFLAAVPGGLLAAKVGVRPTVLGGLALMTAASLLFAVGDTVLVLDLARFGQGVGSALTWAGAFGWLIGAAPKDRRGELIGSALGAAIVGALLGPVIGAAADELGRERVFAFVGACGVALMVWATRMAAVPAEGGTLRSLAVAARDGRVAAGMWLVTLPGLLFGAIAVLVPLRLDALGAGAAIIGATWIAAGALEAVVSPVVGRIADRRGRFGPALFGVAASGVMIALFPWPEARWQLIALMIVTAPLVGILWAPSMALLSDGAEHHGIAQGLAFSLMNLAWASGQTTGSAGGAALAEATSDTVPYLALAAMCAVTVIVLRRRFTGPVAPGTRAAWP